MPYKIFVWFCRNLKASQWIWIALTRDLKWTFPSKASALTGSTAKLSFVRMTQCFIHFISLMSRTGLGTQEAFINCWVHRGLNQCLPRTQYYDAGIGRRPTDRSQARHSNGSRRTLRTIYVSAVFQGSQGFGNAQGKQTHLSLPYSLLQTDKRENIPGWGKNHSQRWKYGR